MSDPFCKLPYQCWPEADRVAWELDCEALDDPFLGPHYGATLREATRSITKKSYGFWLAYLASRSELDAALPAVERVTRPRLRGYFRTILKAGKSDGTIILRFDGLARALKILTPGQDLAWIRRPDGATIYSLLPKIQKSIQAPDSRVLFEWALELMDQATREMRERARLIAYRDGLMIAMLASRARRLRSMSLLRVGHELIWRDGRYRIELTPDLNKTKKHDRFDLPERLTSYIQHYLKIIRPALLADNSHNALWVNRHGVPQTAKGIQGQVHARTMERFKKGFGPHRFRHAAATSAVMRAPNCPGLAAALLGISPDVIDKHYNRAGQVNAALRYDEIVRQLQKDAESAMARQRD